jgi:hypothetical protein
MRQPEPAAQAKTLRAAGRRGGRAPQNKSRHKAIRSEPASQFEVSHRQDVYNRCLSTEDITL